MRRQETKIKSGLGRAEEAGDWSPAPGQECVLGGEVHLDLAGPGRDKAVAGPLEGWGRAGGGLGS